MAIPDKSHPDYPFYISGCYGKEVFEDFKLAHKVLRSRKIASARQVYRCEFCGKIHIGSTQVRRKK
jgi:predicted adenine nucleotide alpha hydrolase (AANH) superfamily ATPase